VNNRRKIRRHHDVVVTTSSRRRRHDVVVTKSSRQTVFYFYICCFIIVVQMSTAGIFWSRSLCLSVIMLLRTKFRVNQKINRPNIAEKRFSLWRPSAMLNLPNCATLSCDRSWKRNLRQHTKLRWNWMIPGWVIAIKPYSKWRPKVDFQYGDRSPFWICKILVFC